MKCLHDHYEISYYFNTSKSYKNFFGTIYQLLPDFYRSWVGKSLNLNVFSLPKCTLCLYALEFIWYKSIPSNLLVDIPYSVMFGAGLIPAFAWNLGVYSNIFALQLIEVTYAVEIYTVGTMFKSS